MKLTPVEFEIMEIVWSRGSALVKEVHAELSRRKGLAYTTVMTEMDHMYKKGLLAHTKRGRAFLYTPRVTRAQALASTLQDFVEDFFHGSREELAHFLSGRPISPEAAVEKKERDKSGLPASAAPAGIPLPPPEERAAIAAEEDDVTLL